MNHVMWPDTGSLPEVADVVVFADMYVLVRTEFICDSLGLSPKSQIRQKWARLGGISLRNNEDGKLISYISIKLAVQRLEELFWYYQVDERSKVVVLVDKLRAKYRQIAITCGLEEVDLPLPAVAGAQND